MARKGAHHLAAKLRAAAERVAENRGGVDAMLEKIIDEEGHAKFFEVVAKFCPREQHIELEQDTAIPVVGFVAMTHEAWNEQHGGKPAITVDNDTGEVLSH